MLGYAGVVTFPTLARRLRSRPVDFRRWRERTVTGTEEAVGGLPVDRYAASVLADGISGGSEAGFARVRASILAVRVFPEDLVRLEVDSSTGGVPGAIVVQRAELGPFAVESAVRIADVRDEPTVAALTWETLEGHPEIGRETFTAELVEDGTIEITIRAQSRPATLLVRLAKPFARWLQRRYSRASVRYLADVARGGFASFIHT